MTTININAVMAKIENDAKEAKFKAIVDAFGKETIIGVVLDHMNEVNNAITEAQAEEDEQFEEAKRKISVSKYLQTYDGDKKEMRPVEFSEKTTKAFNAALKATNTVAWEKGDGCRLGKLTHPGFAKYIIEASGNDPQILIDIINIMKATGWDRGFGITQEKMEIVYHAIVLHRERKSEAVAAVTEILTDFDKTSLRVTANQDNKYRNHLDYTEKMMMYVEDYVCTKICATPLFGRETA